MSFIIYKCMHTTKSLYMWNYIYINMKLNNKLINTKRRPVSRDIYNFIGIVKTYYDLPQTVADRIIYIFTELHYKYQFLIGNKIPYENAVLAATLYAISEFEQRFISKSPPLDITEFVKLMYGEEKAENNIKQIYYCLLKIHCIFD
jgi:hypothetical protein